MTRQALSSAEVPSAANDDPAVSARDRAVQQWRGRASGEPRQQVEAKMPAAEPGPPPTEHGERQEGSRRSLIRRHPLGAALGLVLLLAVGAGGYVYYDAAGHYETTDDAFIAARQFSIAPKVSGYITAVPVTDNQHVKAGDVIARIDDRDYKTALAQADAQVKSAQAAIRNIDAQIDVQQAQITAGQAQVEQAQAGLTFAEQQAKRYQDLARTGSGTVQSEQQYTSQLQQQKAALTSAQANLSVAQVGVAEGAARERRRQSRSGAGPARPGPAQSVVHDRDRGAVRPHCQSQRRRWSVRGTRDGAFDVRAR